MPHPDPHSLIGRSLPGYYHVERLIGSGAFAWVYEARSAVDERVAVKVMKEVSEEARKLFVREVKIMRALPPSPHCVRYVSDGETPEGVPFLVMEYIDGVTLKDALKFKPVWNEVEACQLMLQLCDAFGGLHRLGVAHRDLKPENIMLTRDWRVKLMDFGLVKDAQGLLKLFETEDILAGRDFAENIDKAMLAGTPEYMAPEQFSDPLLEDETQARTDTWTDVYSLGLVFFELLVGRKLFPLAGTFPTQAEFSRALLAYMKSRTTFHDEELVRPDGVNPELWTIVAKAVRQDPRQRQGDAGELSRDIQHFLATGDGVETIDEMTSRVDMNQLFASNPELLAMRDKVLKQMGKSAPKAAAVRAPAPERERSVRMPHPAADEKTQQAPSGIDIAAIQAKTIQELDTAVRFSSGHPPKPEDAAAALATPAPSGESAPAPAGPSPGATAVSAPASSGNRVPAVVWLLLVLALLTAGAAAARLKGFF